MKTSTIHLLSAMVVSGAFSVAAVAQSSAQSSAQSATPASQSSTPSAATGNGMAAEDNSTYATGKPLEQQSKEGFWGHMNPLARKKWVARQVTPIKDRTNELDQLQAKNRNDIHDVDTRATAGINKAMSAADQANQNALAAGQRADAANALAGNASTRTQSLNGTVSNLDQYQTVSATTLPFVAGHTSLGKTAKSDLDEVAAKLGTEKGYIIEVQGYSRAGVPASQAMADSVVRYLVTEHQVPVYRIYRTGLGKQTAAAADGEKPLTNGVRVTLLHNSLATMGTATASNARPSAVTSAPTGVSNPPAN